ncbi:hypothetical protein SAMD00024442_22_34 [Candidatus Symbiothrix dinenymphae]|nr:hypothetical protein SAMD00024442_22_34 [Candidatus Symbiothrix dinenymphae]
MKMNTKEKTQQLIELMKKDCKESDDELRVVLGTSSVDELEKMAMFLDCAACSEKHAPEYKLLELILSHRKWKLDAEFVYTPTAIDKISQINERIMNCLEKLSQETQQELAILKARKANDDAFLHDYDMEYKVTPYIFPKDAELGYLYDAYDGVDEILTKGMVSFDGKTDDEWHPFVSDWDEWSWRLNMPSQVELADFSISYSMYALWAYSFFSLSDIIRINYLRGEIKTIHRHVVEV